MATNLYPQVMSPETEPDYDTPKRFRISDEEWAAFEEAARALHPKGRSPRSKVLRDFVLWYMRRPTAGALKRPDAGPWSTPPE